MLSERAVVEKPSEAERLGARSRPRSLVGFLGGAADRYARAYGKENPAGYALRIRRKKVLELFDKPGGKVLDVGCGPAPVAQDLLNLGCEFWGVDGSERMIELCRSQFGERAKAHFVLGEADRLSFPDSFFDAVLCMGLFDGLPDGEKALREMLRVLKPEGTLIITFTNRRSPHALWKKFVFYPAVSLVRRVTHPELECYRHIFRRRLVSQQTAIELVAQAGVRVERVVGYYYNILLSPLDEIWPGATLRLVKSLEESERDLPSWMPVGLILKAIKA